MGCSHCVKEQLVSTPMVRTQVGTRNFRRQEDDHAVVAGGGQEVGQASNSQRRQPNWSTAGTGYQLKGNTGSGLEDAHIDDLSPEERRQKALEAAQRRQAEVPGLSKKASSELREKQ